MSLIISLRPIKIPIDLIHHLLIIHLSCFEYFLRNEKDLDMDILSGKESEGGGTVHK